ncbi:uncharacterized protein LOC129719812 [Wyeomyia smithii]|uniref:uncharacterized protein LOC129719812 n=1 Tax=Wyeomyia smithii TaxID=174621 RepID=UPI0024680DA8|nr:uncharacterized protein LOC129719812 [Wyeomyia smithii]
MAVTGGSRIIISLTLLLSIYGVLAVSPPAILQCGQCPPNEVLRQSPPACEPTCYQDCQHVPSQYPYAFYYKPTCVCRPGFVRHQGICIPREQCFRPPYQMPRPQNPIGRYCNSNEDLLRSPPCCEPTCFDDCSNKICPLSFIERPTCVCKTGLVRHNGNCINPRQCPRSRSRDEDSDEEDDNDDDSSGGDDDSEENNGKNRKSNSRSSSSNSRNGNSRSSKNRSDSNSRSNSRSNKKSNNSDDDSSEENDNSNNDNVSFKEISPSSSQSEQRSCGKNNICSHPKLPCQNGCLPPPPVAPRHPCDACRRN